LKLSFENYLEYTSQLLGLKQKMFSIIPNFSLENITIYKDKIDPDMLSVLRIYFLTDQDTKENPDIYSYTQKDFRRKLNNRNEALIFQLLIENVQSQLEQLNTQRDQITKTTKFPENIDPDVFYSAADLKKSKEKINNLDLVNAIQIGLDEELTLKKNLD